MSIYDDAGVIQIPSAYKKSVSNGTLYSVVPSNGDGDFTFTRGSNATRVNKDGLIEEVSSHVARLDYPLIDGEVQDCPALLLEPSRTNQITRSEEFENTYWQKASIDVTANQVVSPDGTISADKLKENTSTLNVFAAFHSNTSVAADNYSYSAFIKKGSLRYGGVRAIVNSFVNRFYVNVDLETGIVTSTNTVGTGVAWDYEVEKYPNEWYRVKIYAAHTSGNIDIAVGLSNSATPSYASGLPNYTSTGNDYIYAWGAQIEAGSYATSYIPTSGFAETRSADVCNGSGTSAEFNDSEGVLFAEISALADDGTSRRISLSDSSTSNTVEILLQNSGTVSFQVKSGNSFQGGGTFNLTQTEYNKISVKYKSNDLALWVNGYQHSTDTSANTPIGLSELAFDNGGGGSDFYGKTKQLMTFKTALTDSELETLTSWDSFNAMAKGQLYTIE